MPKDKVKKCPNCGSIVNHDDTFCHKCLAELPEHPEILQLDYPDY